MADVTILLKRYRDGDRAALDALAPVVYSELRKLAVSFMRRERAGSTLQSTALIHEAYLALVDQKLPDSKAAPTSSVLGLLALCVAMFFMFATNLPLGKSTAWYFGETTFGLLAAMALAGWAFYVALGSRQPRKHDFFA